MEFNKNLLLILTTNPFKPTKTPHLHPTYEINNSVPLEEEVVENKEDFILE